MEPAELSSLFEDYGRFHRHPKNKLCHYIGVPLIVFTLVGLLSRVVLFELGGHGVTLAVPVALAALAYDFRLSPRLTLAFAAFVGLSLVLAPHLGNGVLWSGFVLGWVLQFVGHYAYEKKSPAFFENLRQLLVGPLWIIGTLAGRPSAPREAPRSAPLGE